MWDSASVEQTEKGLSLTFGERVYIPSSLRKELMLRLHSTHMSSEMMFQTIKPVWFWEGMKNCLSQLVNNCVECQEWARSKARQPPREVPEELLLKGPMDRLRVDIMSWAGNQYLVMVDYYSYYKWCHEWKRVDTQTVVQVLTNWFNQVHSRQGF